MIGPLPGYVYVCVCVFSEEPTHCSICGLSLCLCPIHVIRGRSFWTLQRPALANELLFRAGMTRLGHGKVVQTEGGELCWSCTCCRLSVSPWLSCMLTHQHCNDAWIRVWSFSTLHTDILGGVICKVTRSKKNNSNNISYLVTKYTRENMRIQG